MAAVIPGMRDWATYKEARLLLRTWWRRRRAVNDNCVACGAMVRMLPGTTAWAQHLCETCARTGRV